VHGGRAGTEVGPGHELAQEAAVLHVHRVEEAELLRDVVHRRLVRGAADVARRQALRRRAGQPRDEEEDRERRRGDDEQQQHRRE
jgi:hypothetical protein